jgi:hypothetical protein
VNFLKKFFSKVLNTKKAVILNDMPRLTPFRKRIDSNLRSGKYVPLRKPSLATGIVLENGKKQVTLVNVEKPSQSGSKAHDATIAKGRGEIRVMFSEKPSLEVTQALEIWKKQGRANPEAARKEILSLFGRINSHPLDVVLKQNLNTNLPEPFVRFIKLYFKKGTK